MHVTLQSSTCFEHQQAHLQEDKLYYHSIWYRHSLYSTVQYALIRHTEDGHVEDCNVTCILLMGRGIVH